MVRVISGYRHIYFRELSRLPSSLAKLDFPTGRLSHLLRTPTKSPIRFESSESPLDTPEPLLTHPRPDDFPASIYETDPTIPITCHQPVPIFRRLSPCAFPNRRDPDSNRQKRITNDRYDTARCRRPIIEEFADFSTISWGGIPPGQKVVHLYRVPAAHDTRPPPMLKFAPEFPKLGGL
jgi:hypothetical protein